MFFGMFPCGYAASPTGKVTLSRAVTNVFTRSGRDNRSRRSSVNALTTLCSLMVLAFAHR